MSLTCELSGEPIATTKETVVATPSGHICIKRLLLQKLAENGGMDPFEAIRERPLSEDQLIELQTKLEPPPRPQVTSLPNLLQMIQTEYDALVLELFDTRKALEDTRRELSQALYQNDAAVRVVARLSMERDAARQELERWNASAGPAPTTTPDAEAPAEETVEEPKSKRRKVERPEGPLQNDLPEGDVQVMVDTWQELNPARKPKIKAMAAQAPSAEMLGTYQKTDTKNWHKSTCRSVIAMAQYEDRVVTAGKDKQVVVYSNESEVVEQTFSMKTVPTGVDICQSVVVASSAKGHLSVWSTEGEGSSLGDASIVERTEIVHVQVHPSAQYVCAATADGRVIVCGWEDGKVVLIAEFKGSEDGVEYTSGAMHPDGLLYAAGTSTGAIHVWDFKNKQLAGNMKEGDDSAVKTISFSENGYHLASSHASAAVRFWDLRKQKLMTTMNEGGEIESITTVVFDPSAKYAAYGGKSGIVITTIKEWGTTAQISTDKPLSGMAWTPKGAILSCSDKERAISFYGAASS